MNTSSPGLPAIRATTRGRVVAAIAAFLSLAVLITASNLKPDDRGVETHTQLGLWPCGWYLATGRPCPTCGMTTAFAHATHGSPLLSFQTQPFGAVLAVLAATMFWAGLHVALFGSRLGVLGDRLLRPSVVVAGALAFLVAWGYKILVMSGVLRL